MPKGNPKAYSSGYIMGQMKKQGEMNEVGTSLFREKLDPKVMGENSGAFQQTASPSTTPGSIHMKQAGYIMGQSKYIK